MNIEVRKYLSTIGQRGGQKSRRVLDAKTARDMVRVREARRAYRRFHASCFWSFDPNYVLTLSDIPWVAAELRKHGGRAAWETANRLCR
jgi:hypothetical protein